MFKITLVNDIIIERLRLYVLILNSAEAFKLGAFLKWIGLMRIQHTSRGALNRRKFITFAHFYYLNI